MIRVQEVAQKLAPSLETDYFRTYLYQTRTADAAEFSLNTMDGFALWLREVAQLPNDEIIRISEYVFEMMIRRN